MKSRFILRFAAIAVMIPVTFLWLRGPREMASAESSEASGALRQAGPELLHAAPAIPTPGLAVEAPAAEASGAVGIRDRLKKPRVLETREHRLADGRIYRARLLRVEEKYPLVVYEGKVPTGNPGADDRLLENARARVADHLVVSPKAGITEAAFRRAVEGMAMTVGERLSQGGPYLLGLPVASIHAVDEAIFKLQAAGVVAYAEPDYLVHAADLPGADRDVDRVNGVSSYPQLALDESTLPPPAGPVLDPAAQEMAAELRLHDLPPGARLLTFDQPSFMAGPGSYRPYMEEQNFRLSTTEGLYVDSPGSEFGPNNGTNSARSLSTETNFTVKHREGLPFDLVSLDLSEYSAYDAVPKSVTFTGYKADGGTVSQTLVTDGVIDGVGPLADFENFTFNSGFANLIKVVANTTGFKVDNIAVVMKGQETPPPAPPAPPFIYDATWDAPIHSLGQLTAVGGPYAPTSVNSGTPTVRAQVGTLAGPALEFKGTGYQQCHFSIQRYARAYRLEFDACIDLPVDFAIFFDGPGGAQSFSFKSDGKMKLFQSFVANIQSFGSYPRGQTMRVLVDVDMVGQSWSIHVNGVRQHLGAFGVSSGDLASIRFAAAGSATGVAGVDNVRIQAFDPGSQSIPGPRIAVLPESLNFPGVVAGSGKTWSLYLRNQGRQNLNVQSVVSSDSQFLVNWLSPVSLLPGGSVAVPVEFRPRAFGPVSGQLTITSDDPERPAVSVSLTGTGDNIPTLTLDPPGLDVTMIAGTTGLKTFNLGNAGAGELSWNLHLKQAVITGEAGPGLAPDDPLFASQWSLRSPAAGSGGIDAGRAWRATTGSSSVIVAVTDTGVDRTHPDLQGNLWVNPAEVADNGIDDDLNGYIDDVHGWDFHNRDNDPADGYGHGTHVAGTIAARGDNALGVAGVCWNARILPLKFLSDSGAGYTSDAVSAVGYATRMGARVTNNSWGGGGYSQALRDAIHAAGEAGCLFVASAGNDGADNDANPRFPSCYDLGSIISVAATDASDAFSSFSNYGPATVDVAAPGADILSLRPGGEYRISSGTSMAAPHVAGVAALLLSRNPTLPPARLKEILTLGADTLPALGNRVASGGRLQAPRSLEVAIPECLQPGISSGVVASGQSVGIPLAVDTRQLEPGTYPLVVTISSNDPARPRVDLPLRLQIIPGDGYDRWAANHFAGNGMLANVAEAALWGDAADPDGDRMSNLIEFITGSSPSATDPESSSAMSLQPSGPCFEFRVREHLDGATYHVEWTTDLSSPAWRVDGLVTVDETTEGQPEGTRRVRMKLADTDVPSAFFRLCGRRDP